MRQIVREVQNKKELRKIKAKLVKGPTFIITHEDVTGREINVLEIKGDFDREGIEKAILLVVSDMNEGDTVEYEKDDKSKLYAGAILMLRLQKTKGIVMRQIMQGAHTGHFVKFNYFKGK